MKSNIIDWLDALFPEGHRIECIAYFIGCIACIIIAIWALLNI